MGGVVCTVIFVSNQPVVLGCVGVGVLTIDLHANFFFLKQILSTEPNLTENRELK